MIFERYDNKRIFGLDFVRAIAIFFVVLSHIDYLIEDISYSLKSLFHTLGYFGVELFFVLSGFLIGNILLKMYEKNNLSLESIFGFLKRRWFRTLPNYYLILIINILIALYFNYEFKGWINYLFFIQNFYEDKISFFPESWTISIEEWTYFVAPFILFVGRKIIKNYKSFFVLAITGVIVMVILFRLINFLNFRVYDMDNWNIHIKSIVLLRIDAIFFGFILAWMYNYKHDLLKRYANLFLILGFLLFILQFYIFNVIGFNINTNPLYYHVFFFTLTSITTTLILSFFIFWNNTNSIFQKPILLISKISYSIYLLHYSVISVLLKYLFNYYEITLHFLLTFFIYFTITFMFSYVLYRFYEYPMMNLRDRKNK